MSVFFDETPTCKSDIESTICDAFAYKFNLFLGIVLPGGFNPPDE